MKSLTILLPDTDYEALARKAKIEKCTPKQLVRKLVGNGVHRKDKRPKALAGSTQLVLNCVFPFINKVQHLSNFDEESKKTIEKALQPAFRYFLGRVFPELSQEDCDHNLEQALRTFRVSEFEECRELAVNIRKMIYIASTRDSEPDGDLDEWINSSAGQMVFKLRNWSYNEARFTSFPKNVHTGKEHPFHHWLLPQVAATFIFWVRCAFDVTACESKHSNGEYFLGICKQCNTAFEKRSIDAKHCSNRCIRLSEKAERKSSR